MVEMLILVLLVSHVTLGRTSLMGTRPFMNVVAWWLTMEIE